MAATIKDIAKTLNISTSTVSYALNGGPRRVPDAVRERVLATAAELGYRPNRIARSMVTGRTNTFGVCQPGATALNAISPYFQTIVNGILGGSEQVTHDVLIFTAFDEKYPERYLDRILDGRIDGLIFLAPPSGWQLLHHVALEKIPFVVANAHSVNGCPSIMCDNSAGVEMALRHLLELRHRKIGLLYGKPELDDAVERLDAFKRIAQSGEFECQPNWVLDGNFTPADGYEAAKKLLTLPNRPTAVFCCNDEMAIGFIRAATELGINVPNEVSVVGFDNSPMSASIHPQITTVQQPLLSMGQAAAHALNRLVSGERVGNQSFSPRLIVRASTNCPLEDN